MHTHHTQSLQGGVPIVSQTPGDLRVTCQAGRGEHSQRVQAVTLTDVVLYLLSCASLVRLKIRQTHWYLVSTQQTCLYGPAICVAGGK